MSRGGPGCTLHRQRQIARNFLCDNNSPAWPFTEVLIDPSHVIKKLSNRFVSTLANLEFNHDEPLVVVNSQNINTTVINWKFYAAPLSSFVQTQARFDTIQVS